ncbi:hypothetical protein OC846_006277 [Tilletia horrida]|uniref:Uncharacterized protein n=1 Tax=Tilletia horrida TaxID=155126 RepID=A0AAN6JV66_9BASI|nr:hypothetical protein OC845_006286 [Tilletia horrida]KAK0543813.1 hypothetical protein OC846_006277 [Tilletia horrida]
MNASVHQLSDRIESVRHLLQTEALRQASLHAAAESQAKAKPPPTSTEVISAFCQWTERSCTAAVAKCITDRSSALQPVKTQISAYKLTISRIASLEEAARAEVAMANIFRHLDRSAERAVFSCLTSSDVASSEVSSTTVIPRVLDSITHATTELRLRLTTALHEKVEELIRREVADFSRTIREVLDSAARNLHSEHLEDASIQPELDPFGFLFSDIQPSSREANPNNHTVRTSRPSAVAQSRTLQEVLQCRIQSDSKLLRAVVAAISNSALRLGSRMNIWALGLLHVYKHEGPNVSSQLKAAPKFPTDVEAAERILKLVDLYTELALSSIQELLRELPNRIASPHANRDGLSARIGFSLKVVETIRKRMVLSRILVRLDDTRVRAEAAISNALEAARNESRQAWRTSALDQAVSEFSRYSSAEVPQASEDGTNSAGPSLALLQAVESLKSSVLELGLQPARTLMQDSSDLISGLVDRLSGAVLEDAPAQAEFSILRSICSGPKAEVEGRGNALVLLKAALGPLLPQS